jgi:hypothetical protein
MNNQTIFDDVLNGTRTQGYSRAINADGQLMLWQGDVSSPLGFAIPGIARVDSMNQPDITVYQVLHKFNLLRKVMGRAQISGPMLEEMEAVHDVFTGDDYPAHFESEMRRIAHKYGVSLGRDTR